MKPSVKEIALFGMLGALMYASKTVMQALPNIHLLGTIIVAATVVFRAKALYPIYLYVFLDGLFSGFSTWWIPYLYIWTILWGMVMLLPKKMPEKIKYIVYMVVCSLHGFLFGTLYAPFQALMYGLGFKGMVAWIVAGLHFDMIHGVSNFVCGVLIFPLTAILEKAAKYTSPKFSKKTQ